MDQDEQEDDLILQSRDSPDDDVDRYSCCYGAFNEDAERNHWPQYNNNLVISLTRAKAKAMHHLDEQKNQHKNIKGGNNIKNNNNNNNCNGHQNDRHALDGIHKKTKNTSGQTDESIKNTNTEGETKSKATQSNDMNNTPGVIDTDVESDNGSESSNDSFEKKALM